jgi:protocatechuate 3,4-dioxygenase beta subunit
MKKCVFYLWAGVLVLFPAVLLGQTGSVSGRVTDPLNNGVAGVNVEFFNSSTGAVIAEVVTGADGNFTKAGLAAGTYKVLFSMEYGGPALVPEWYNNKATFAAADVITVTGGGALTGIDAQLVYDPNEPNDSLAEAQLITPGAYADLIGYATGDQDWHKTYVNQGKDIRFSVGNSRPFSPADADDIDISIRDATGAILVQAISSSGSETIYVANVNAGYYYVVVDYLPRGLYDITVEVGDLALGDITGRVTNSLGAGVQNIAVYLYPSDFPDWAHIHGWVPTDANGNFKVSDVPGSYKIQFTRDDRFAVPNDVYVIAGEWYNDTTDSTKAQVLTITLGGTTPGIDAELDDGAAITGRLTNASGNPVANQWVYAHDKYGNVLASGITNANGEYLIGGIRVEDGTCKVRFRNNPGAEAFEWYNDKTSFGAGDWVNIQPRQTTAGIDAQLAPEGKIQGRVEDGAGNGIPNVNVIAWDTTQTLVQMGSSLTNGDGFYLIRYLPTANARVQIHANTTSFATEWHNNKASYESADSLSVTAGSTVGPIVPVLAAGGGISGTVTSQATGAGMSGVRVELYTMANEFSQRVTTDTSGNYSFNGVAAGNYKMFFNNANGAFFLSEWYGDKADFASADTLTVAAGGTLSGRHAILTQIGAVRGRVTNLSAVGIQNVTVQVRDQSNQSVGSDTTDSLGYYYIRLIPPGTYWVHFNGGPAGYASVYYNGKATHASADTITVNGGEWTKYVNAQLGAPGGISGRITGPGGTGIQNIKVRIYDAFNTTTIDVLTDVSGDYAATGIAPGAYRIFFMNNGLNYVSEFYNDRWSFAGANDVAVLSGSTTSGVNAQLSAGGTISGTVTDGSAGLSGVRAVLYDLSGNQAGFAVTTDGGGNYSFLAVPAGSYKLFFNTRPNNVNAVSEWHNDKAVFGTADVLNVTSGGTLSGVNAVLAAGGIFSGRVTSLATGVGIPEVWVTALDSGGVGIAAGLTDANGNYEVRGLPTGSYRLEFDPRTYNANNAGSFLREYFNNKTTFSAGDPLAITAGQTLGGVNASLSGGGASISGRVTNAAGMGLRNVTVWVMTDWSLLGAYPQDTTDSGGTYAIYGIPAGTYSVFFTANGTPWNYAPEYYDNVVPGAGAPNGTPVVLSAGQALGGIDAVLEAAGTVAGRVTDGAGNGVPNIRLRFFDAATNGYSAQQNVLTDGGGYYTAWRIRPGSKKAVFQSFENGGGQWAGEFFNDKISLPSADAFGVTAGLTTPNIDAVLGPASAGGAIDGHVRDYLGNGLHEAMVEIYSSADAESFLGGIWTDEDGAFAFAGLPAGSYKMRVMFKGILPEEWFNDKATYAAADGIAVTVGQTTTADVFLGDAGTLTLTSPNGGEALTAGLVHDITWTSTGTVGNVKLEYSTNSGAAWTAIEASTPNDGSHAWTVPSAPSTTCLVRVSETDGNPSDTSNAVFTINTPVVPTITVTSPNGGEVWAGGSPQAITWTSTGTVGNVIVEYSTNGGGSWTTIIASTANDGTHPWTVPNVPSALCLVRVSETDGSPSDVSDTAFTITTGSDVKEDLVGTWDGQAVYYRNSTSGLWTILASPADLIACGDLFGDGKDDLIGIWASQAGVWAKSSADASWTHLSSTARHIAAGDMNGDGRVDFLGTWDGQGVYYRDSISGVWTQIATPADLITAGDLDGDGTDDLIGIWSGQAGVWVKFSQSGDWTFLGSSASDIATADMNGDGRADLLGTWVGQGVFFRNSMNGVWTQLATPADLIAAGDLDGDGTGDLIGIWAGQAGVWVRYSQTQTWTFIASSARDIDAGKMSAGNWSAGSVKIQELAWPMGGFIDGPGSVAFIDFSAEGPGGRYFAPQIERRLAPPNPPALRNRIPGPGESGFKCEIQENLSPVEKTIKK